MTKDPYDKFDYTTEDLLLAEYVGFPLYVSVRTRLEDLGCPVELVNAAIGEAIAVHDENKMKNGVGFSEIVVREKDGRVDVWIEDL